MSNTRLVRIIMQRHGIPYVAFERRRYFGEELTKFVGQMIKVRKCQAGDNLITAVTPDGRSEFHLHAQRSSSS